MYTQFQAAEPPPNWGSWYGSQGILKWWDQALQADIKNKDTRERPLGAPNDYGIHWTSQNLAHCNPSVLITAFNELCNRNYNIHIKMDNLLTIAEAIQTTNEAENLKMPFRELITRILQIQDRYTWKDSEGYVHEASHVHESLYLDKDGKTMDFSYLQSIADMCPDIFNGFEFDARPLNIVVNNRNIGHLINADLINKGATIIFEQIGDKRTLYNGSTQLLEVNIMQQGNIEGYLTCIETYWNPCLQLNISSILNRTNISGNPQLYFGDNHLKNLLKRVTKRHAPHIIRIQDTAITYEAFLDLLEWAQDIKIELDITLSNGISMTLNIPKNT